MALKILDEASKEAKKNEINDVEWVCNNEKYKDFEIRSNVAAIAKIRSLPLDCIKIVRNGIMSHTVNGWYTEFEEMNTENLVDSVTVTQWRKLRKRPLMMLMQTTIFTC